jgi:hypothetical protein
MLNLLLAGTAGWLVLAPIEINAPVVPPPRSSPETSRHVFQPETGKPARPLFARVEPPAPPQPILPPPASPRPSAPPPPKDPTIRLVGTIDGETGLVAFIAVEGVPEMKRVVQGGDVAGWRVAAVRVREVELEKAGKKTRLMLDPPGAP